MEQNPSKTSASQLLVGEHRVVQEMCPGNVYNQKHVEVNI